MSGGRHPRIGIPWPGGGGSIAYLGSATVTDADGSMSQLVTVPANTDYAIIFVGGWAGATARTVSSMALGGTSADNLYTRANSDDYQDSYVYGVATSPGSKTFAATLSGAFSEGGVAILVFLSGVNSSNPLVASNYAETTGTVVTSATWSGMASVASGLGLVFATAYANTKTLTITAQSQTQIVSSSYNSDLYAAGYKSTAGSTETLGITVSGVADFWGAVAVTLRPA